MAVATKEIQNSKNAPITVFCDSQKALTAIQHTLSGKENRYLRGLIYDRARELQKMGHSIVFRWIPAHSGLIGNDKAHIAAKSRAEKGGKQAESWSSLAYIKKNVSQIRGKELTSWHERKTQERETSRHGFYIPWTKAEINPVLGKAPKRKILRVCHNPKGCK